MRAALVAVMVLLSACAGEAAVETTTTTEPVEPPSTTPTTVWESTTTTTVAAEPVDICPRGVVWEPGLTYVADCFAVPVSFEPKDEGWRSSGAGLQHVEGLWNEESLPEPSIRFAFIRLDDAGDIDEALDSVVGIEGVNPRSDRVASSMGERPAAFVDVETEPSPVSRFADDPCVLNLGYAINLASGGEPGYPLLAVNQDEVYGLGACRQFRVWAVGVGGETILAIATTDDLDRFDELMPIVQRLLDSMTFATP